MIHPHDSLLPYLDEAHRAGFEIHVPQDRLSRAVANYVHITHPDLPGCVLLERATFSSLGQTPELTVPVAPSRVHGNGVHVDFTGQPAELVETLKHVLASDTVLTRWVAEPTRVAVVPRIPRTAARYVPNTALAQAR